VVALTAAGGSDATFVTLPNEYLTDSLLGYTNIDPATAAVKVYALNYYHKLDPENYIGWTGDLHAYPGVDTMIYVNNKSKFTRMYFRFDTIASPTLGTQEYGYPVKGSTWEGKIAQLVRQPYRLTYEDPLKYTCIHDFAVTNAADHSYAVAPRGSYRTELGKPVFYLRNTYFRNGDAYFALVQTLDSTTIWDPSQAGLSTAFTNYLKTEYGNTLANTVINKLSAVTGPGAEFNRGLFVAAVQELGPSVKNPQLIMTLRADAQTRISTFRLEEDTDPLYRRIGDLEEDGPGNGPEYDAPRTLKFFQYNNKQLQLYENTGAVNDEANSWQGPRANYGKRNYLGEANTYAAAHANTNTNIYVDTAYVARGTGWIKPQYMLVVRPQWVDPREVCSPATGNKIPVGFTYLRGHYLINAFDSAHTEKGLDARYLWDSQWERLIFVDAIHARDYLFIVEGLSENVRKEFEFEPGVFDLDKLEADAKLDPDERKVKSVYLNNNYHKDCVFSFRFVERDATDFTIESETSEQRDVLIPEPIIAPCDGAWIKVQNNVPTITRAKDNNGVVIRDAMNEATVFNVKAGDGWESATANETVEAPAQITVIGDAGAVTILGAAGKKVVITNVLGQTVTSAVLTSDNATVAAPKGIAVVSVEGEKAVKAIVK
jgi:hypothetical protein